MSVHGNYSTATVPTVNLYINKDALSNVFVFLVNKDPIQTFRCAGVCKLWQLLTNQNSLWKEIASRLNISYTDSQKKRVIKQEIAHIMTTGFDAIMRIETNHLLSFDEKRTWFFNAINAQIRRLPIGDKQRARLENSLDQKHKEKMQRLEMLKAAFNGHLFFSFLGKKNALVKAKEIATLLASDKYLDKGPYQILVDLEQKVT